MCVCVCVCVCTAYIGVCHAVMVISVTQMGIGRELGLCCIMIRGDCYCVDDEIGYFFTRCLDGRPGTAGGLWGHED